MKHLIVIILFFFSISSCDQINSSDSKVDLPNDDSMKIESLKWLMYALNNNGRIKATDSSGRIFEFSVVELEIELVSKYKKADTLSCMFRFYKQGYDRIGMSNVLPVRGLSEASSKIYFLDFYHAVPDFSKKVDSVQWYIGKANKEFEKFIQQYDGKMSSWLKNELVNRGLISKQ